MRLLINSILAGFTMGLIAIIMCCMTGCKTLRHTSERVTAAARLTDSASNTRTEKVAEVTASATNKETKDTTVGLRPISISHTGDNDTVIRSGHVTLRTYTGKDGRRHTECTADSLTLVIKGLVRERETLTHSRDSAISALEQRKTEQHTHVNTLKEVVRETNRGFVFLAKHALYVLLALLAGMAIQKWTMPFINRLTRHYGRVW